MSLNGKKVIVTGGAGFIGSALSALLAKSGAHIHIIDNLVNGKRENVADILSNECILHELDIRQTDQLKPIFENCDVVFHLACLGVRHSISHPQENHDVNANATLSLLELSKTANVSCFVYTSTSEVYGDAQTAPMDENHPTFPKTVYGGSKLAGEAYTRAFYETYQFPTVVIRPFNAYGPRCHHEGDSGEVIPKFMLRAMVGKDLVVFGDGTQTRDFTYVEDTAAGIMAAANHPNALGQTINLGSGSEIQILDLAQKIKTLVGQDNASNIIHDDDRPGDVLRLCANSTKASKLLGFKAQTSFEDGLEKLKQWYADSNDSPETLLKEEQVHNWQDTKTKVAV